MGLRWGCRSFRRLSLNLQLIISAYRLLRTPPQATKIIPIPKLPNRPRPGQKKTGRGKGPMVHSSEEEIQAALGEVSQIHSKDVIDS
jgi:hypothetical protein